jgi:ElaB/YqjD/DUF883 family membrane-anchored ribosome-binding protein
MNPNTSSVDNGHTPSDPQARSTLADASERVRRGVDSVRARARRLTAGARSASQGASNYVRNEPIKALLIAFAVGAAVSALVGLMNRSRDNG